MNSLERKEYIEVLRNLPGKLDTATRDLSDKQLDTPVGENKWTPRQITHHLADAHVNGYVRMKLVVTEEKPILKPYDQDKWAGLPDAKSVGVSTSLGILKGLHDRWVQFLEALPESSWKREGIHLENGKVTLEELLRTYAKHCESHLQQIVTFRQAKGW